MDPFKKKWRVNELTRQLPKITAKSRFRSIYQSISADKKKKKAAAERAFSDRRKQKGGKELKLHLEGNV
jgi:hypothetical protein